MSASTEKAKTQLTKAFEDHESWCVAFSSGDYDKAREIHAKMVADLALFKAQTKIMEDRIKSDLTRIFGNRVGRWIYKIWGN